MGIIYVVENKINGKCYVGQTNREWPIRRKEHENKPQMYSYIDKAIQKYGKNSFEWEIIDESDDQDTLNMLERLHISRYEASVEGWGYNLKEGGSNGEHSEVSRQKMSEFHKGKKILKETRRKMSDSKKGEKNPMYGKNHSKETRRKISDAKRGNEGYWSGKKFSKEHRRKISEFQTGRKHSEETLKKMSKSSQGKKYPGASFEKSANPETRCWRTSINFKGYKKSLGVYEDPISASLVYQLVLNELYKE